MRIQSPLVAQGKLHARLAFPRGYDMSVKNTPALDWSHPESHESRLIDNVIPGGTFIQRTIDETRYAAVLSKPVTRLAPHLFRIAGDRKSDTLEFSIQFLPGDKQPPALPEKAAQIFSDSAAHWERFWNEGAAVDFSGSTNPLAQKLEERIVLSQYLMAVQMAGDVPPQESGLTCSTWYGKHHTEMIWWHTAHFALWDHAELLAKNLEWYRAHLPEARALAASRGLRGARWAKMVGPDGRESPGGNPLIVWNQPHLIYLCELLYRNKPSAATLAAYRDLVLETADCLASMALFRPEAPAGMYSALLCGSPRRSTIRLRVRIRRLSFPTGAGRWASRSNGANDSDCRGIKSGTTLSLAFPHCLWRTASTSRSNRTRIPGKTSTAGTIIRRC